MRRLALHVLAATVALAPIATWGQDLILSSDDGDDELLLDGDAVNFEDALKRLGELKDISDSLGGDANGDGRVNLVDPIYLLNWFFLDGPAPASISCELPSGEVTDGPSPFARIGLRIEFNETDGTAELALGAGSDEGLQSLTVHDPSNRRILDLRSSEGREIDLEKIVLETREATLEGIRSAYPEGAYLFQGVTMAGTHLVGEAELTHDLPPAPLLTHQISEGRLTVYWSPSGEATSYSLEIDQDDAGFNLRVTLDATRGSYSLPTELLVAGSAHDLSLTAALPGGNRITEEITVVIPPVSQAAE